MCCSPWGHKESDTTEWLNWTELTEDEGCGSSPQIWRCNTSYIKTSKTWTVGTLQPSSEVAPWNRGKVILSVENCEQYSLLLIMYGGDNGLSLNIHWFLCRNQCSNTRSLEHGSGLRVSIYLCPTWMPTDVRSSPKRYSITNWTRWSIPSYECQSLYWLSPVVLMQWVMNDAVTVSGTEAIHELPSTNFLSSRMI